MGFISLGKEKRKNMNTMQLTMRPFSQIFTSKSIGSIYFHSLRDTHSLLIFPAPG